MFQWKSLSAVMVVLAAGSACEKSDFSKIEQLDVKQAMTLRISKNKSITVPVGPIAAELQFATKTKKRIIQSGMILKVQGQTVPFDLKSQSISVVKNQRGRKVPQYLEHLKVTAADSGQNLGVDIAVLARKHIDTISTTIEACVYTTFEMVCDSDGRCRQEPVDNPGTCTYELGEIGDITEYRLGLSDADGAVAASGVLKVDSVQYVNGCVSACR